MGTKAEEKMLLDTIAATKDIKHPLRVAYIDYIGECRVDGCVALPFFQWLRETQEVK